MRLEVRWNEIGRQSTTRKTRFSSRGRRCLLPSSPFVLEGRKPLRGDRGRSLAPSRAAECVRCR